MDAKAKGYACPRCTVGRCAPQTTTFVDVYHGHVVEQAQHAHLHLRCLPFCRI